MELKILKRHLKQLEVIINMKNKDVISSFVGAGFFAVGYLGLSLALPPALALGAVSFLASELIVTSGKKTIEEKREKSFKEKINDAKNSNKYIKNMTNSIEDEIVQRDLKDISESTGKIIDFIEKNEIKNKTSNKFLDYYLPVCVKIIENYDDIENQKLTSSDSKKFMDDGKRIIKDTNKAFKKILNSLYQSDIVNAEAEMKVFNTILKADGYDESILESGDIDE